MGPAPRTPFPADLEKLLLSVVAGPIVTAQELENQAALKGAYLLIITLDHDFDLEIKTLPATRLKAGSYIYSGSAFGPGGMKARLKRHFSTTKRRHWHIDHLSLAAISMRALVLADGNECHLVNALLKSRQFQQPVRGFGASDCRTCQSHLLYWSGRNPG